MMVWVQVTQGVSQVGVQGFATQEREKAWLGLLQRPWFDHPYRFLSRVDLLVLLMHNNPREDQTAVNECAQVCMYYLTN